MGHERGRQPFRPALWEGRTMIKRLLVPLDGSHLAEQALKVAGDVAEGTSATIVAVRVVPPPIPGRFYAPNLLDQLQAAQLKEAEAYLLRGDRLSVETRAASGAVADTLAGLAASERCDIIVMSSHGLGGVGWRVFGSVAQKVLHSAPCPILIVRPSQDELDREEEEEEEQADEALLGELTQSQQRGASGAS
jgi:nucleotide-binding universal stress UspA family protein